MERRSKFRSLTNVVVRCRVPASPDQAIIHDISVGGCKIVTESFILEPGATILLELTASCQAVGRVMWTKGETAGIKFESKVSQNTVETFNGDSQRSVAINLPFSQQREDGSTGITG